jgi:ribosomal protein S18 acetylase RimI-like enzyme
MSFEARPYRDLRDLQRMKRLVVDAWRVSPRLTYFHVGDVDWRLFGPHGFPLSEIVRLWEERDTLCAWALLTSEGVDFQVTLDRSASTIEGEILDWAQGETLRWQREHGLSERFVVEVRAEDTDRIDTLVELGLEPTATGGVQFVRSLSSLPDAWTPEGWQVRGLREPDIDGRAITQREAFAPGSRTTPDTWRYLIAQAPGYDPDLDSVAVSPDGTVGSAALAWLDTENNVGEFEPVATHPAFQRLGLGAAVLRRGMWRMRERGMETAIVQTNATNAAAIALYRSVGFQEAGRTVEYALVAPRDLTTMPV